ncbi:methyltransferase domain-containing protein [Paraglaciecola sp. L3A3]|uniref:methyltransferase domain-containing protein n=1 Tax=Paraglaciecola sp. L3A3 TaxID=2686358 RepID=UPI00131DC64F|nr:methyltransferase domain-containing protein [Paraglaciecola sp. L3A3]
MSVSAQLTCHKSRIAQQFSRAAKSYDSAADVQQKIAQDAMALLSAGGHNLLDIGCGTGRNIPLLAAKSHRIYGLDLAFGMLSYAQQNKQIKDKNVHWLQGDAEHLPLASQSVDRVFSSMVLQWCHHPELVVAEINRVLSSGSEAVLAIMCDGSFTQLNHSWQQLDNIKHVNDFASAQIWHEAALKQGLQVQLSTKKYDTWYANLRQLLASIKCIGANIVLPNEQTQLVVQKPFNRHILQNLETVYQELFAENTQLPLTYQVCLLHCIKP